jgi:dolichol-phosphate mannosyltransferase
MATAKTLIIIPTYNEKENIPLIVPSILQTVPHVEILVVDDNSPDGTAEIVKTMAATTPALHLLQRPGKQGLGPAYIAGFRWALQRDYELIFEMDADFSHDPKYLPDMLAMAEKADLVIGSRYLTGVNVVNWPMFRLVLSYGGNMVARMIAGLPVRDCTAGFKCFRRKVLETVPLDRVGSSGYSFQIEMNYYTWKRGFIIREVPIVFTDRRFGTSKMSTKIIREALLLLWKLRFRSLINRG